MTSSTNNSSSNDDNVDLNEQLNRALAAVQANRAKALELYQAWRTYLLRLSYILVLVSFHQFQSPSSYCLRQIKEFNKQEEETFQSTRNTISGFQATGLVLQDSIVEVLSIVCGLCLVWCLSLNNDTMGGGDFASVPYRLSCICIPMMVSLYFSNRQMGCVPQPSSFEEESPPRAFPVMLVFHLITSLSLYFMHYHCRRQDDNVAAIVKLKNDLTEARKTNSNQRQKKSSTSSSNSNNKKKTKKS